MEEKKKKPKRIRQTHASYLWAFMIVIGAHNFLEKREPSKPRGGLLGCLSRIVEIPFKIPVIGWFFNLPFRVYYASLYLQEEGIWLVVTDDDIEFVMQDFDEPESVTDLLALLLGLEERTLVHVKQLKASSVDTFSPRAQFFGLMHRFSVGSSSGKDNIFTITIDGSAKRTIKKMKEHVKKATDSQKVDTFAKKVKEQADFELAVEKEKDVRKHAS